MPLPTHLKWDCPPRVNCPGCLLTVRYTPQIAPFRRTMDAANFQNSALHAKVSDELETRPKDKLFWAVVADPSRKALPQATLREHLQRRWRHAFHQALREKGLTFDGYRQASGEKGIYGTLELVIQNGQGFNSPFSDLVSQSRSILSHLLKMQLAAGDNPGFRTVPVSKIGPGRNFQRI